MPALQWDQSGERLYETGVDHGVLYPLDATGAYKPGVAWNGLTTLTETPSGADSNAQYADNIKYLNLIAAETFEGTIEAFTYPEEFAVCDGTVAPVEGVTVGQQSRRVFGMCYRSRVGNDVDGTDHGYRLHLIYGARLHLRRRPTPRSMTSRRRSRSRGTSRPRRFRWKAMTMSSRPRCSSSIRPRSIRPSSRHSRPSSSAVPQWLSCLCRETSSTIWPQVS
jgi:hypothetical protein